LPVTHKIVTDIQNFFAPNEQAHIDEIINGCREQNQSQVFVERNTDECGLSCVKLDSGVQGFLGFELCKGYKTGGHLRTLAKEQGFPEVVSDYGALRAG
jgi:hypothetical protein